jgi:acyl-CoA synthetase (AMP-forming)/AMP-acid ligase II
MSDVPWRLWDLITWRAELTPEHTVLSNDQGRSLSFAGLRDAARRVAAGLAASGVGDGTRVMWQLPTSLESVVLSVALARLGAVQNPLIAVLREAEIRALDKQFKPELAVVPSRWRGFDHAAAIREIAGTRTRILVCDHWEAPADGLALPQADPSGLPPLPAIDGPRWVYTTSGSTAHPKGVLHTDASVYASSNSMVAQFPLGPADVFPMAYPYAHIGGIAWLVTALRLGCGIVLFDVFDAVSSPVAMARTGRRFSAAPLRSSVPTSRPSGRTGRVRCSSGGRPSGASPTG